MTKRYYKRTYLGSKVDLIVVYVYVAYNFNGDNGINTYMYYAFRVPHEFAGVFDIKYITNNYKKTNECYWSSGPEIWFEI